MKRHGISAQSSVHRSHRMSQELRFQVAGKDCKQKENGMCHLCAESVACDTIVFAMENKQARRRRMYN